MWSQRRPELPRENPLVFFPRHVARTIAKYSSVAVYAWRLNRKRKRIQRQPEAKAYTDLALTPVVDATEETLEMFELNDSARAAVATVRAQDAARTKHERERALEHEKQVA